MKNYPFYLLAVFAVLFIALGISPSSRSVWVAEVIPVALAVVLLAAGSGDSVSATGPTR